MKIRIDFSPVLKNPDGLSYYTKTDGMGNPTNGSMPLTMADSVRVHVLSTQTKGSILKMLGWCGELEESEQLELDEEDFKLLYNLVEGSDNILLYVKGPILKQMNKAKSDAESPKKEETVSEAAKRGFLS